MWKSLLPRTQLNQQPSVLAPENSGTPGEDWERKGVGSSVHYSPSKPQARRTTRTQCWPVSGNRKRRNRHSVRARQLQLYLRMQPTSASKGCFVHGFRCKPHAFSCHLHPFIILLCREVLMIFPRGISNF